LQDGTTFALYINAQNEMKESGRGQLKSETFPLALKVSGVCTSRLRSEAAKGAET